MSHTGPDEYPDGSVGRYVRERWAQNAQRSQRQAPDDQDRAQEERSQGGAHAQHPGLGARRDETWGVVPDDAGWGSDLLELEGELDEVEPYPAPGGREGRHAEPRQRHEHREQHREQSPEPRPEQGPEQRPAEYPGEYPGPRRPEPPAQRTGPEQRPAAPNGAAPSGGPHGTTSHGAPPEGAAPGGRATGGTTRHEPVPNGSATNGRLPNGSLPNGASGNGDVPRAAAPNGAAPAQPRDRGAQPRGEASPPPAPPQWRTAGQRPAGERSADERTAGERTAGERTAGERTAGERTAGERTAGERPVGERAGAERPRERRVVPQEGRTPPRGMPLGPPTGPNRPIRDVGRWTDPGAVAAQEAQQARADSDADLADLSTARLLKPGKRRPPRTGWRRFLYLLTGRLINPGESPQDIRERELTTRINQPLLGCHKIATLSLKGGVGKTTITATLGATFASLRGDRVVAVDANPDRGTLSQKIPLETSATVRHLLRDAQRIRRYTDVRAYTSQGPSRLEVLASEQDPAVSEAFSEDDYRRTVTLLEHFYNIVLTDCGTGLMHSAMYGVLGVADQLIIVSSGSIDGARSASATMDWLEAHDHGDLVRNAVAVINNVHRQAGAVDLERVAQHFAGRCRAVVQIPFDPHLEEGAEVDLERLSPPTRLALLELAASVADGFPS
ncbi:hypothetical protein GCM10023215_64680 [Pseudonocardia yuanmonensis]|uniref:CobQ/CobB/MinD/ParA nucleotide binding domain-containing protein n=1 Tax=Pseudonocardia yuanmonensis TaxID=1095914 RepID=A0ABP8XTB2_9PSEU